MKTGKWRAKGVVNKWNSSVDSCETQERKKRGREVDDRSSKQSADELFFQNTSGAGWCFGQ